MAFINAKKWKEISEAAKGGNQKASAILASFSNRDCKQEDIDSLLGDYYKPTEEPKADAPEELEEISEEAPEEIPEEAESEPEVEIEETDVETPKKDLAEQADDIAARLDKELDGLIDEDKPDELSFRDFLKNKKRDSARARKNREYFAAFDPQEREAYLAKKKEDYGHKYDSAKDDLSRAFSDMDYAIGDYMDHANSLDDDDGELDMKIAGKAYDELADSDDHAFGRPWDQDDTDKVYSIIDDMVGRYGKKNVLAALNALRDDNKSYADYKGKKIATAIADYGKALDKLLK